MNILPGKNLKYNQFRWNRPVIFITLLLISTVCLSGQTIEIKAEQVPLNQALMHLAHEYGIQLSFNDQLLSSYLVSHQNGYMSPEQAIQALISDFPLQYEKIGEVYTIYKPERSAQVKQWQLSGRVIDSHSGEALPYSHILVNQTGIVTDFNGHFSMVSEDDSIYNVTASCLGYYIQDTILKAGTEQQIPLDPSIIGLKEVTIEGRMVERSGEQGTKGGEIKLNHKIAYRLPGNGDNSIFNFLRLQPGILAAGERSSEIVIWGSYSGHSKISFDGFTIYGLKNFNDNISFANPYMIKDIRILKGGFGAEYGDRVGGIVEVSGNTGSYQKPTINLNINNMTVNGMASVPLSDRSALTFAYRHTYYNLLKDDDLRVESRPRPISSPVDINIYPDYTFRDFNLKYAGTTSLGDDYFISLYEGRDRFSYSIGQELGDIGINQDSEEVNHQSGGTAFIGRTWNNGFISHFSTGYSSLDRNEYEQLEVNHIPADSVMTTTDALYRNDILEYAVRSKHYMSLSDRHQLIIGLNYTYETIGYEQDSADITLLGLNEKAHRLSMFVQDEISPARGLVITPSVRIDYPLNLGKIYVQPRLQVSVELLPNIRMNGSWGLYNQFISDAFVIDELGNYRNFWTICDNETIPVLQANHLIGGITFTSKGYTLAVESFYKKTTGVTRLIDLRINEVPEIFQGLARVYGMDVMFKKHFRKHEAWVSYTISKTEEYFSYYPFADYSDSPHDQRHEVKGALLLNFSPFYFSTNYVYGSGFPDRLVFFNNTINRYPYNRLDVAFIYRHSIKNYNFEAGISILNVFNTENIKYTNFIRIPDGQSNTLGIHAEAVPFTPTIYLNLSF